jgi:Ala-tRNA(Pro) deacylase
MFNLHFDRIRISSARGKHGPVDMTGIPMRLINYLNDNQVQYEILHQPWISNDSEAKKAKSRIARFHAKVVMVKARQQHVLTVLPHSSCVDLKRLSNFVGESVCLDTEEEFKWLFPDCVLDAIPPFGNLYGLPTVSDSELSKNDYIVFRAGTTSDYIKLSYPTYERIAQPRIAAFSVKIALGRPEKDS